MNKLPLITAIVRLNSLSWFIGVIPWLLDVPGEVFGVERDRTPYFGIQHVITLCVILLHIIMNLSFSAIFLTRAEWIARWALRGLEHLDVLASDAWPPAPKE